MPFVVNNAGRASWLNATTNSRRIRPQHGNLRRSHRSSPTSSAQSEPSRFPQRNPTQEISGNRLALHWHYQDLLSQTGRFGRRQAGFEPRQAGFETGQAHFEASSLPFASLFAGGE
jgi:hypothetical protein